MLLLRSALQSFDLSLSAAPLWSDRWAGLCLRWSGRSACKFLELRLGREVQGARNEYAMQLAIERADFDGDSAKPVKSKAHRFFFGIFMNVMKIESGLLSQ